MRTAALRLSRPLLCIFATVVLSVVLGGVAEASSTLEARGRDLARSVEELIRRKVVHRAGKMKPRGLVLISSGSVDTPVSSVLTRLQASTIVDFEDRSTNSELLTLLEKAAAETKFQHPEVQNDRYKRIYERLRGVGYDFWVLLSSQSDTDVLRMSAHVVYGERGCQGDPSRDPACFSTADYLEVKVPLSVRRAEGVAMELGVGWIHRTLDQTAFGLGSGGVLSRFPTSAEVGQSVILASAEMPRFLIEGALAKGDNFSAVSDSHLDGEQREISVAVEGLPARGRRVGLLLGGAYRNIKEEVVDDRFDAEASAEYSFSDASLGIAYGNLVNGVTLRGFGLYSTAEDTSPGRTFSGLPGAMWEDNGYGGELRARRTTESWEIDFRARKYLVTREFDQSYFPDLSDADMEGVGFRLEVRKRLRSFGIGAVWSQSEMQFADAPSATPQSRLVAEQKDSFFGLNMSFRWHPD